MILNEVQNASEIVGTLWDSCSLAKFIIIIEELRYHNSNTIKHSLAVNIKSKLKIINTIQASDRELIMIKVKVGLIFVLLTTSLYGCVPTNSSEIDDLKNEIYAMETDLEVSENTINEMNVELLKAYESKKAISHTYGSYLIEENQEFASYILKNPIDKKYEEDFSEISDRPASETSELRYLDRSYKRLWEIEMEYALNRIQKIVDEEAFEHIERSQESYYASAESFNIFLRETFRKHDLEIVDYNSKTEYYKSPYRNRAIELLEILYILEGGREPSMLYSAYIENESKTNEAMSRIGEFYWGDIDKLVPFKHKLSTVSTDGILIFEVHGYRIVGNEDDYLTWISVDNIDVFDESRSLIQSIELENTLVPSEVSLDYGFEITDWNFDGYPDISIYALQGGSMGNVPSYYWLWDDKQSMYIFNEELTDFSQASYLRVDNTSQEVISSFRAQGHHAYYYSWNSGELIPVRYEGIDWVSEGDSNYKSYLVKEVYENDEWIEVERTLYEED